MTDFSYNLALIIGINQYQNGIAKLNTANPDAEELANLLRNEYQYQVELITDGDNSERNGTKKSYKPCCISITSMNALIAVDTWLRSLFFVGAVKWKR